MPDVGQLLQALLAPSIFISAAALLLLSLNTRLMGIVARLRQFHREMQDAVLAGRAQEAAALEHQMGSVEKRAEQIRRAFLFTLFSLGGTILSCLLLGLGLYWHAARLIAVGVFVTAILAMLVAVANYIAEALVALSSVRDEARFFQQVSRTRRRRREDDDLPSTQGGM